MGEGLWGRPTCIIGGGRCGGHGEGGERLALGHVDHIVVAHKGKVDYLAARICEEAGGCDAEQR
jgi:hypothetical protein